MNLPNDFLKLCLSETDSWYLMRSYMTYAGISDVDVYRHICAGEICDICGHKARRYGLEWNNICPVCSCNLKSLRPHGREVVCTSCRSMIEACETRGFRYITAIVVPSDIFTEVTRTTDDTI